MSTLKTYAAVKDPLKPKKKAKKKTKANKETEMTPEEIQHRLKLIAKAFK